MASDLLSLPSEQEPEVEELKSKEEYYIKFHDKLLDAHKEATEAINGYMLTCYLLVGFMVLTYSGSISKVIFNGIEVKLDHLGQYTTILVYLIYLVMSFHMLRLARIFRAIRRNASTLLRINKNARILDIPDLGLLLPGVSGIMLAAARLQMGYFVKRILKAPVQIFQDFLVGVVDMKQNPADWSNWRIAVFGVKIVVRMYFTFVGVLTGISLLVFAIALTLVYFPLPTCFSLLESMQGLTQTKFMQLPLFDQFLTVGLFVLSLIVFACWAAMSFFYSTDFLRGLADDIDRALPALATFVESTPASAQAANLPKWEEVQATLKNLQATLQSW